MFSFLFGVETDSFVVIREDLLDSHRGLWSFGHGSFYISLSEIGVLGVLDVWVISKFLSPPPTHYKTLKQTLLVYSHSKEALAVF